MPIDYKNYPDDWNKIRKSVLRRANDHCEWCGVRNASEIQRHKKNSAIYRYPYAGDEYLDGMEGPWFNPVKVVLTIAHLDHDPGNNEPGNLAALCQRCHLRYDGPLHKHNAVRTRAAKKENGIWLIYFDNQQGGHFICKNAKAARAKFDKLKLNSSVRLFCQTEEST